MTQVPFARSFAAGGAESAGARTLRLGFGLLWLLDGLLLAQPRMFGPALVAEVLRPAGAGEPGWVRALVAWSVHVMTPHLLAFHLLLIAAQLLAGALLLMGARPALLRAGAVLSVGLGLGIWLFGEGCGQLFGGASSLLGGAPGPALLYALAGVVLLAGTHAVAPGPGRRSLLAWLITAFFALGVALELNPLFFTGSGLADVFRLGASLAQPWPLRAPLLWLARVAAAGPAAVNAVILAAFALAAVAVQGTAHARAGGAVLAGLLVLVAALWWLGEDLGMPFAGMATDPNTAGPLVVLLLAARAADRQPSATCADVGGAGAGPRAAAARRRTAS